MAAVQLDACNKTTVKTTVDDVAATWNWPFLAQPAAQWDSVYSTSSLLD